MKKYTFALMALLIAGSVFAAETNTTASATATEGHGRRGAPTAEQKAKMLEKFDADGDGALCDAERSTMRESMMSRRGGKGGKEGRNGKGGKEGKNGRGRMSPEKRQALIDQYDADGDGELSDTERATAKAAWKAAKDTSAVENTTTE